MLNKELKYYYQQFTTIDLDFIDIFDKCYTIPNNKHYTGQYTLYEYCIILDQYRYIKKYSQ